MLRRFFSIPATSSMGRAQSAWKPLVALLALGFALSVASTRARADSFTLGLATIDQQNQFVAGGINSFNASVGTADFAQEFTPTLTSLSVVELQLGGPTTPAIVTINIRPATSGETSLSTISLGSASTTINDNMESFREFDFASPVALTPGNLYVIDATINVPGFVAAATTLNQYPGGRAFYLGAFQSDQDFRFVEGPLTSPTPEPTSLLLCVSGLLGLGGASWRRYRSK